MKADTKVKRYLRIFDQIKGLISATTDPISRMATISAILHHKMPDFYWTGFYLLKEGQLLVGPYQGPVACLKLKKDTGVCWAGINTKESVVVADVAEFPGHIACSSISKSEVVVPVVNRNREIIGVLDVDSKDLNTFDETDRVHLEKIVGLIF